MEFVTGVTGSPADADDGGTEPGSEGRSQGGDEEQGGQITRPRVKPFPTRISRNASILIGLGP